MATNIFVCGVCNFRQVTTSSIVWCSECDEGLCADCQEHHVASKGTRNHKTIPINEYRKLPSDVLEITQSCDKHNEMLQLFCKKHDMPCCRRCMLESHIECKDIAAIDDVIHNVKSSRVFVDIEHILSELAKNIGEIRKNREENLTTLNVERKQIEDKLQETRKNIDKHLDKVQEELIKELCLTENSESDKIRTMLTQLHQTETDISELRNTLRNIKEHGSDLQAFLAIKKIESAVNKKEEIIQSIARSEAMKQTTLSCQLNQTIQTLSTVIERFGEVVIEKKPSIDLHIKKTNKQAQNVVPFPKMCYQSFNRTTLHLQQTVNTRSSEVRGCILLPDDKILVTEHTYPGRIIVMKSDGSINRHVINVPYKAFDLTYIESDNSVAVTSSWSRHKYINIVDLEKRIIKKTVKVLSDSYGLVLRDSDILYASDKGIQRLNLRDESLSEIIKTTGKASYITVYRDKIYFTQHDNHTVSCCSMQGSVEWDFKDENILKCPAGISVDNEGSLYVAGLKSENVVIISPDGQNHRQILSKEDGLNWPIVLHYQTTTNKLLVVNDRGDALLFEVKTS